MIDIEVHGFDAERGKVVGVTILALLRKLGLVEDVMLSVHPKPSEFLKVSDPEGKDVSEIVQKLKSLGFDARPNP